jgi:uncharacterized membrane protein YecN with MAPEG domain
MVPHSRAADPDRSDPLPEAARRDSVVECVPLRSSLGIEMRQEEVMPLGITALYALVLTLIGSYLAFRAGSMRGKTGISIWYGDNQQLALEMRRHGNFVEFVPLTLILMGIVELNGISPWVLHAAGSLTVVARILHPMGLEAESISNPLRGLGAAGTLLGSAILMGALAVQLLR